MSHGKANNNRSSMNWKDTKGLTFQLLEMAESEFFFHTKEKIRLSFFKLVAL